MYAVVKYNDYRKEQSFEVIITTCDIEYAKKVAFQNTKNDIPQSSDNSIYKITTKSENEYLRPINKTIISYRIINVEKYKSGFRKLYHFSTIYAVIEIKPDIENIQEIDSSFICDNYYNVDEEEEEQEEQEEQY
jgi:hypothetical protein